MDEKYYLQLSILFPSEDFRVNYKITWKQISNVDVVDICKYWGGGGQVCLERVAVARHHAILIITLVVECFSVITCPNEGSFVRKACKKNKATSLDVLSRNNSLATWNWTDIIEKRKLLACLCM